MRADAHRGPLPSFLPLIWNQKQNEKKEKSPEICELLSSNPSFFSAVVSFPRIKRVPLDTCQDTGASHLPVVKMLTALAGQVWEQRTAQGAGLCRVPGPGIPGAAGHPRALCSVTGGGRVRAAGPSQQPAWLGFSPGHPWGEEARLGLAASVSGFCLASWLWARSSL